MMGIAHFILKNNSFQKVDFSIFDYSLLILSTVIIAAAGNMINDYFISLFDFIIFSNLSKNS